MVKLGKKAKLPKAGKVIGKFAFKSAQNRAFRTRHGLRYSGSSSSRPATSTVLRSFEQESFQDIHKLSARDSQRMLFDKGLLVKVKRNHERFYCWGCGKHMLVQADNTLRCGVKACSVRARVSDPQLAFTPWINCAQTRSQPNWQLFLRTAYCLGLRMAPDQSAHMCRQPEESIRASYEKVLRAFTCHKIALAFTETCLARSTVFQYEIVEADTARTAGRKDGKKRHHTGRTLIMKGRGTKKWTAQALQPSTSTGRRGCPPETAQEVSTPLRHSIGRGSLLAADGATAWQKAAPAPLLGGVSHYRKLFTPTAKVDKRALTFEQTRMLRKKSTGKKDLAPCSKLARECRRHFSVASGDNAAEGVIGNLKNTLRRIGGTGKNKGDYRRAIDALASSALLRKPGIATILAAHVQYRKAGLTGELGISPKKFYEPSACDWLFADPD